MGSRLRLLVLSKLWGCKNKEELSMNLRRRILIVLSIALLAVVTSSCTSAEDKEASFLAQAGTACVTELASSNTVQDFQTAARESLPLACRFVIAADEVAKSEASQSELAATLVSQGLAKNVKKLNEAVPTLCFNDLGKSGQTYSFLPSSRSSLPVSCQYGYGQSDLKDLTQLKLDLELKLSQQFNAATTQATPSVISTATP